MENRNSIASADTFETERLSMFGLAREENWVQFLHLVRMHTNNPRLSEAHAETTLLHLAVAAGVDEACVALIEAGFNVNVRDGQGCTALHIAARKGYVKIIKHLLTSGTHFTCNKHGFTPLHEAILSSFYEAASSLIPEARKTKLLDAQGEDGQTVLHLAARHPDSSFINLLLKEEIDVNILDNYGKTPLDRAEGTSRNALERRGAFTGDSFQNPTMSAISASSASSSSSSRRKRFCGCF